MFKADKAGTDKSRIRQHLHITTNLHGFERFTESVSLSPTMAAGYVTRRLTLVWSPDARLLGAPGGENVLALEQEIYSEGKLIKRLQQWQGVETVVLNTSRDSVSPACGLFLNFMLKKNALCCLAANSTFCKLAL